MDFSFQSRIFGEDHINPLLIFLVCYYMIVGSRILLILKEQNQPKRIQGICLKQLLPITDLETNANYFHMCSISLLRIFYYVHFKNNGKNKNKGIRTP